MANRPASDVAWWTTKIVEKIDGRAFNKHVGLHAVTILTHMAKAPGGQVRGARLRHVADELGVPTKYLVRSLGLLSRHDLIGVSMGDQIIITFAPPPISPRRAHKSKRVRQYFFELEGRRCGHCGRRNLSDRELRIDHIVPLSMLGADEPGNWGALCIDCNRDKWHNFDREWLQRYRNEPVTKNVGVRYSGGFLWPCINGRARKETLDRFILRMNRARAQS